MKTCITCKHYRERWWDLGCVVALAPCCDRRATVDTNPVTGESDISGKRPFCADERGRHFWGQHCGPDGRFWESKE